MTSAREDVQTATSKLISAQHKIAELERDLEIRQFGVEDLIRLASQRQEFASKVIDLEHSVERWKSCYAFSNKQRNETQARLLEAEEKIVALEKGIERLKNSPRSFSFERLMEAFVQQKKELKNLKDNAQFERDNILSEIRKVLGAKDRNADRPHETALQAAKRVVEEFRNLKDTAKLAQQVLDSELKDLKKLKSNTLYCLQIDQNTETDKAISELKRQLIKFSYKEPYDKLFKEFGRLQDLVLGKGSTTETYEDLFTPIEDLIKFRNFILNDLNAPEIVGIGRPKAIVGGYSTLSLDQLLRVYREGKKGARTYTPPERHVVVETQHYDDLLRLANKKSNLTRFVDFKDLKALQDKVNEVHNIIDKINND